MGKTEIQAAGAVLWRPSTEGRPHRVALVHRPRYDDWSLPKGKLDAGESAPAAAVREIREETGAECVLGPFLDRVDYQVHDVPKVVDYFVARYTGGEFVPGDEVDDVRWLSVEHAREVLSYRLDADVLDRFARLGSGLTTVLLARHAKAGSRDDWRGDDDLRPLTANGERQAAALSGLLRLFGPDRVLSAPRLRCVQTVREIADGLPAEIGHEPLLSETDYQGSPGDALRRLRDIAADGGTPLICSQGGVIPSLVSSLAEADGLPLPDVPAKKASTWVLAFRSTSNAAHNGTGPRLVAAHYLPPPPAE